MEYLYFAYEHYFGPYKVHSSYHMNDGTFYICHCDLILGQNNVHIANK